MNREFASGQGVHPTELYVAPRRNLSLADTSQQASLKMCHKPVLNWVNFCFVNLVREFGERSMFGDIVFREPGSDYSTNCGDAVFGVQNASLHICLVRRTLRLIG